VRFERSYPTLADYLSLGRARIKFCALSSQAHGDSTRISRMIEDFLVLSNRIYHEYQRVIRSFVARAWTTQRAKQMMAACGSISTAA
jgi:hypothetical protein